MSLNTLHLFASNYEDVQKAIQLLRNGHTVAVPTETVYGLAVDAKQEDALQTLFRIKKRPSHHPLIVHVASLEDVKEWVIDLSDEALALATTFWPGPLTLILKKAPWVSPIVTGGLETIAIRIPQNEVLRFILSELKTGLAAPSANLHKQLSPTTASHVLDALSGSISAVLDDGPCLFGLESTIIDLTQSPPVLLRPGPLLPSHLQSLLKNLQITSDAVYHAPGGMKAHYQPKAAASICTLEDIFTHLSEASQKQVSCGVIYHSEDALFSPHIKKILMPKDAMEYAQRLYSSLHDLDQAGLGKILIETPPNTSDWIAVWDRLNRASYLAG